jgi:hypothetical protein
MSMLLNGLIFFITFVLTVLFFRKDGKWNAERGIKAFRFFTVQSNVFCAVSALLLCIFPSPRWVWLLKYAGTAAVCVTMLTVLFYLGPMAGYKKMLSGPDLFMHLITPLLALVSFTVFEKRGMSFSEALLGLLPVVLYGSLYLYRIIIAPKDKAWEDFYGFNQGGRYYLSMAAMFIGTFLLCMGLMALHSL